MIINIDFDGTCVTHDFPKVGKKIGAEKVLKRLVRNRHQLILFTMRSNKKEVYSLSPNIIAVSDNYLDQAVKWFKDNEIDLFGINTNPSQFSWTDSPKSFADLIIDDTSLGCPLIYDKNISNNPFVDWVKVEKMLEVMGYLKH